MKFNLHLLKHHTVMFRDLFMNNSKKSRKLYGYITENLENNTAEPTQTIGSLKFFKNKKISRQLKLLYGGDTEIDNSYEIFDVYKSRPKSSFRCGNKPISGTKKTRISISYHKPTPKKKYAGSKSNKRKSKKSKSKSKSKSESKSKSKSKSKSTKYKIKKIHGNTPLYDGYSDKYCHHKKKDKKN